MSVFTKAYIQEFESHSDRMGVKRRIALSSLTVSTDTLNNPIFDEVKGGVDDCISYYTELLAMLHTAKERLDNSTGGVR